MGRRSGKPDRRPPRRGVLVVLLVLLALLMGLDWVRDGSFLKQVLPGGGDALWTQDFIDQLQSGEGR